LKYLLLYYIFFFPFYSENKLHASFSSLVESFMTFNCQNVHCRLRKLKILSDTGGRGVFWLHGAS
jgi:hypothetical protein